MTVPRGLERLERGNASGREKNQGEAADLGGLYRCAGPRGMRRHQQQLHPQRRHGKQQHQQREQHQREQYEREQYERKQHQR